MVTAIFNGPTWFFGVDSVFEALSSIVSLSVFIASMKMYFLTKEKKYRYFSLAFALLTLSFLIRMVTDLVVHTKFSQSFENIMQNLVSTSKIFIIGYICHIVLTLVAYIILLSFVFQIRNKKSFTLFLSLLLVLILFSGSYYLSFYFSSLIMLIFITHYYLKNYVQAATTPKLLVFISFGLLALAQLQFLLQLFHGLFYVTAFITQLLGYFTLLLTIIRVWQRWEERR